MKYLVLVAPVVVEGFPNKGTPDQLRVAMLYLLSEMPSLEPGLQNKLRPRQDRPQGRVPNKVRAPVTVTLPQYVPCGNPATTEPLRDL